MGSTAKVALNDEPQSKPPINYPGADDAALVVPVEEFVEKYMAAYDPSHDYKHVLRVRDNAVALANDSRNEFSTTPNMLVVSLASLLHDVGDHKYRKEGDPSLEQVLSKVLEAFDQSIIELVTTVVKNVSYSKEIKNPEAVAEMCKKIPELAIVQDADRLDALGAIGIARTFAFGGTRNNPLYGEPKSTLAHFDDKLFNLREMMKTIAGQEKAVVLENRMRMFKSWIEDEARLV